MKIKEKVLKDLFMIFPMPEADSLKYIRESAKKIIEEKYLGLEEIEKAIDLTLAEVKRESFEKSKKEALINHKLGQEYKLVEVGKEISKIINEKKKIAERNLTSVQDSDGKGTTLYIYLGLLEDSIKQKLGIK